MSHHRCAVLPRALWVLLALVLLAPATSQAIPPRDAEPVPPCKRANPPSYCFQKSPTGQLDSVTRPPAGLVVTGRATEPDYAAPVTVYVEVNGRHAGELVANGPGGSFLGTVPAVAGTEVCVWARNRGQGEDALLGCRALTVLVDPIGHLDGVVGGPAGIRVSGWAIDPDQTSSVTVEVYVDGILTQEAAASGSRPDVAAVHPVYGDAHGYDLTVPAKGHPTVCVDALNTGPGSRTRLGCAVATQDPPPVPADVQTMTVATLNIVGNDGTATSPAYGLGSFAERLEALANATRGFDVVGLQEVDSPGQVDQLAAHGGYAYAVTGPGAPSKFPDVALLSRVPMTDVQRYEGPKPGCVLGIECGGAVWILAATVQLHDKPVRIVNTHLSVDYQYPSGHYLDRSAWRAAQARFIKQTLVDPFPGRVVVTGDFNSNTDLIAPNGPLTDAGATALSLVEGTDGSTHCASERLDLILPRSPIRTLAYDGVYGGSCSPSGLSDHPRVSAVLALGSSAITPDPTPDPTPEEDAPDPKVCATKPWTPGC